MGIAYLLIGLIVGAFVGAFFMKNQLSSIDSGEQNKINTLETERLLALQRLKDADIVIERVKEDFTQRINKLEQDLEQKRAENLELNNKLTGAREHFKAQEQRLNEQKAELDETKRKMMLEFESISNRLFDEKSKKFTDQNKEQLGVILNPLNEKLKDFQERVEKSYKMESDERISLKKEIENLVKLNTQLSGDAINLTNALKGDNKQQGNWGELILEKVLESSGLEKDREYKKQFSTVNDENLGIKPDFVIFLPDNKQIIIDAKVSLDAYEQYSSASTDLDFNLYAKKHIESVRSHIKLLSEKKYQTAENLHTPDFVLLFLPIESSFSLAMKVDQELFNYAWDRKIVIVSPTTLLATLRTVASIWKQERQTRNVLEIAKEGGALYDKFVGFIEDMEKINRGLSTSQSAYNDAIKKLSEGGGNIITRTEKLKKLGARAEKSIPEKYLESTITSEDKTIENR